jgi:hypothetical protein
MTRAELAVPENVAPPEGPSERGAPFMYH